MIKVILCKLVLLQLFTTFQGQILCEMPLLSKPNRTLLKKIKSTDGLVALWKFDEKPGKERKALGLGTFPLQESVREIDRINEGPLSGYSIKLDGTNYLTLPQSQTGQLNIYGEKRGVTVIAWIKWTGEQTGFVGGMWNEYQDGGKRQYGLER